MPSRHAGSRWSAARCACAAALALFALTSSAAWAAPTPSDEAAAEALFREARALMDAGHIEQACPKLHESNRLDPGAGTLLNLGDCYERIGRTASAWGAFTQAEALARGRGDDVRRQEAARRAQALEGKQSRLTIAVAEAAPGLLVRRDGAPIGEGLWGSAVPVDPGRYTIEASAPGRKPWTGSVVVEAEGATARIDVPVLAPAEVSSPPPAERRTTPGGWGTQRTAAVVVGSVGAIGLVVGAVFGAQAVGKNSDVEERCPEGAPRVCDAEGVTLHDEAVTAANVSNVAFAIGGAAMVAGIVLFATAPAGDAPTGAAAKVSALRIDVRTRVGPGDAGIGLRGEW